MMYFTNDLSCDRWKAIAGINLGLVSLSTLIPLTCLIAEVAIPILLNPRVNISVTNTFAILGFGYLSYEIFVFSRLIIMKSLSIIRGPNEYIFHSFHGYKFEWLKPEKHLAPTLSIHVDSDGNPFGLYTYP
jgi:hypothetical protein